MGEGAEDDLDALVAVVVLVPGRGADALRAQCGEAVAFGVELAAPALGLLGVEQVPVLGHHQEDQAVDEAQKLVEPFGEIDLAGFQLGREIGVGFEEAGAEHLERDLDLVGQPVARGLALAGPGVAPAFERAVGCGRAGDAEAGAVDQRARARRRRRRPRW